MVNATAPAAAAGLRHPRHPRTVALMAMLWCGLASAQVFSAAPESVPGSAPANLSTTPSAASTPSGPPAELALATRYAELMAPASDEASRRSAIGLAQQIMNTPTRRGFLYEARRGAQHLYVYGASTSQPLNASTFPLHLELLKALDRSAVVWLDVPAGLEADTTAEALRLASLPEGQSVVNLLPTSSAAALWAKAPALLGMSAQQAERLQPWLLNEAAAQQAQQQAGWSPRAGSRAVVQHVAQLAGKPVGWLLPPVVDVTTLTQTPADAALARLVWNLSAPPAERMAAPQAQLAAWAKGDLAAYASATQAQAAAEPGGAWRQQALQTRSLRVMAALSKLLADPASLPPHAATPLATHTAPGSATTFGPSPDASPATGSWLVVVDTAQLPGAQGLLEQLRRIGFVLGDAASTSGAARLAPL